MNKRDHPKKWNTYKDIKNKTQKLEYIAFPEAIIKIFRKIYVYTFYFKKKK